MDKSQKLDKQLANYAVLEESIEKEVSRIVRAYLNELESEYPRHKFKFIRYGMSEGLTFEPQIRKTNWLNHLPDYVTKRSNVFRYLFSIQEEITSFLDDIENEYRIGIFDEF